MLHSFPAAYMAVSPSSRSLGRMFKQFVTNKALIPITSKAQNRWTARCRFVEEKLSLLCIAGNCRWLVEFTELWIIIFIPNIVVFQKSFLIWIFLFPLEGKYGRVFPSHIWHRGQIWEGKIASMYMASSSYSRDFYICFNYFFTLNMWTNAEDVKV